jgi:hypothetical protein
MITGWTRSWLLRLSMITHAAREHDPRIGGGVKGID